ncbi:MAG TPA: ABC transporter substrate-binding protein [Candidatus Binatia bacterium]|jgi:ABC-type nitrate/sulfonate/bicarbonate transport system substrate-binding protein|nr:ABC transporter substrate-binding protein [Candidatus Binatia bacterium]
MDDQEFVGQETNAESWRLRKGIAMTTFHKMLALFGIVLATCTGSNSESTAQSQSLTAFYTAPVVSMSPMWIAKEAGFFKKQGLDVRLVFIASGPVGTTSVLGGETDVGIIGGFAPTRAIVGSDWALTGSVPTRTCSLKQPYPVFRSIH